MSTADRNEQITGLKRRAAKLDQEIEGLKAEQRRQATQMSLLMQERKTVMQSIEALTPRAATVSDHALVRYLERVMGVDVESVRRRILETNQVGQMIDVLGDANVPLGEGAVAVVKNRCVVTIKTRDEGLSGQKPAGGKRKPTKHARPPRRREVDEADMNTMEG